MSVATKRAAREPSTGPTRREDKARSPAVCVADVTVDLGVLPAPLADAVPAARGRRARVAFKPFVPTGPEPLIADWAREVVQSGELDAAIAEVSAADPDRFVTTGCCSTFSLAPSHPNCLTAPGGGVATTFSWYCRLARALATGRIEGSLSRHYGDLSADSHHLGQAGSLRGETCGRYSSLHDTCGSETRR